MLAFLVEVQRTIHASLSADIAAFATDRNWAALLAVLPVGVLFGAAHALTPGHSKALLATYVAGSGAGAAKAFLTALTLAVTHIASAVIIASAANWLVSRSLTSAGQTPALELASRLLLVGIGLWLVARAVWRRPHMPGEGLAVGFMAGLVPCPLTLFLMFYATSKGVPEAGLTFAMAMLLGVGSVLVVVALLSALARRHVAALTSRHGVTLGQASRMIDIGAGLLLVTLALVELAG